MYPARVDEKGRLKLPTGFKTYFEGLVEKKLFVTSLDRRVGQIYTAEVWRKNQKLFQEYRANPKAAKNIGFNASDLGADSEMDKEGRILLPPELRRELGIENQPVKICSYKGRIEIYSDAVYQERRRAATATAEQDVEELEGAGLL